jgi:hypothetical protein
MKTKNKKGRSRGRSQRRRSETYCSAPEGVRIAFMPLFAPLRNDSWPNVECSYLFDGNGKTMDGRTNRY